MKTKNPPQTVLQSRKKLGGERALAGPDGLAVAPPTYGIESLDRTQVAAAREDGQVPCGPLQLKAGVAANDNVGLGCQADRIGAWANTARGYSKKGEQESLQDHGSLLANPVVQRRAPTATELGLTASGQDANLFDARLDTGKLFTKRINVASHLSSSVIPAYIDAIRPVGNVAAGFPGYTDAVMVSPAPTLGLGAWPPPVAGAFDVALAAQMGLGPAGIVNVRGKTKPQAVDWLTAAAEQPEMNVNSGNFAWVDPFQVEFTFNSTTHSQRPWEITTQFADSGTGYITKIKNGEKDVTGTIKTQADFTNLENNAAASKNDFIYSSTHDQGDEFFANKISNISSYAQGSTQGENELGFDAITWLAAEGARFEPVRRIGRDTKPTTAFYVKPNANWIGAMSVDLTWLMQNWGAHFHKAYNISTATMRGIVAANGVAITARPPRRRFNLTTDQVE